MRPILAALAAMLCLMAGPVLAQGDAPPPVTSGDTPGLAAPATTPPANPNIEVLPDGSTIEHVPAPPPIVSGAPVAQKNPAMTGPQILLSTTMGDITLQLDYVRAPKSTANIVRYVRAKHYDNTAFYRVVKGFIIQMGSWDAAMKPRSIFRETVPLEANNGLSNIRGAVAMAHGEDPNSATAEFFISVGDNSTLDHAGDDTANVTGFAVFGQVISGMDVVDKINQGAVGDGGPMPGQTPLEPVVIKKASIVPGTDAMLPPEKKAAAAAAPTKPAKKK